MIPLTAPLAQALHHVESLIGRVGHDTPLIPLGDDQSLWRKQRNAWLRMICDLAGLPVLTMHDLRRAANLAWNSAEKESGNWLLGHAMQGVNARYYDSGLPRLLKGCNALTNPFEPLA